MDAISQFGSTKGSHAAQLAIAHNADGATGGDDAFVKIRGHEILGSERRARNETGDVRGTNVVYAHDTVSGAMATSLALYRASRTKTHM
jgi:hypothetical protein